MKLDDARVASFLRDPGPVRVVLLHGDDDGLVRQRADALTRAIVGQTDDPFRVAWLMREDHGRLMEESTAIAMTGGRRVVRVRDATDTLAAAVKQAATASGESVVVLECGTLAKRSKLRTLVEGLPTGAAIACYPEEGRALRGTVTAALAAAGVSIEPECLDWLGDHLGRDRGSTRAEVEKLILFAGTDRRLDLESVRACVGDLAAVSFDDAIYAAVAGNVSLADASIERTLGEGLAPVAITRGVLSHLSRLHWAQGHMRTGMSVQDAVRALRPPVFFKRMAAFGQAVSLWSGPRLVAAMRETSRVEMLCKQSGAPDVVLVRRLMMSLARQGQALAARRGVKA